MMIEKLVPLSLILIGIGGFGSFVEYILFGSMNLIVIGYIGLAISVVLFMIVIYYWNKDSIKG